MDARLIDPAARSLTPVREMVDALLADCRPHALALGCADALDQVQPLAAANGAARQRAFVNHHRRLDELVARLAGRFLAPDGRAAVVRDISQIRQKGAANVPLARILRFTDSSERSALRGD
jgi:hypothetical protein